VRAGLLRFNSRQAALFEGVEDLVIALAAKTVLLSDVSDIVLQALAFHEHQETTSQLVGGGNGQRAGWAGELMGLSVEPEVWVHEERLKEEGGYV